MRAGIPITKTVHACRYVLMLFEAKMLFYSVNIE